MKRLTVYALLCVLLLILGCEEQDESAKVVNPETGQPLVDINHIRSCMGKDVVIEYKSDTGPTEFRYGILHSVTMRTNGSLYCAITKPDGQSENITLWDARAINPPLVSSVPLQVQILNPDVIKQK